MLVTSAAPPSTDPRLLSRTDQCVICSLCLRHGPTYRLDAIEAEPPGGRIALVRALATGALAPTPTDNWTIPAHD